MTKPSRRVMALALLTTAAAFVGGVMVGRTTSIATGAGEHQREQEQEPRAAARPGEPARGRQPTPQEHVPPPSPQPLAGEDDASSPPAPVPVPPAAQHLGRIAAVAGAVRFDGSPPRFGVLVRVTPSSARPSAPITVAASPPDFAFNVAELPAGRCRFDVGLPLGVDLGATERDLIGGENRVVVDARSVGDEDTLVLRVVDRDGRTLDPERLSVRVAYEGPSGNGLAKGQLDVRPDGSILIPSVRPPGDSDRRFAIVEWLGHDVREVDLAGATDNVVVVRFGDDANASVRVRLVGVPPGSPKVGVLVVPRGRTLDRVAVPFYETWLDGGERWISRLAPGAADVVTVTAASAASNDLRELARRPLELVAGDNSVEIPYPETGQIAMRVEASFVELYSAELPRVRQRIDSRLTEGGRVLFEGIPSGEWRVVPYARDDEPKGESVVRTVAVIEQTFVPADGLEAYVADLDPGGSAAAAGLQAGDVIVRANGIEPTTGFEWARHVRSLASMGTVAVVVARATSRVELSVPGGIFVSREAGGARLMLRNR